MTLSSAIEAELLTLQAEAEARMVDACTIRRTTDADPIIDPVTLQLTPVYTTVYTGKCRLRQGGAMSREREAGERISIGIGVMVSIPVATTGVQVGDEVRVTTSRDPELVGKTFRVTALERQTDTTARRLECEEAQT